VAEKKKAAKPDPDAEALARALKGKPKEEKKP